MKKQHLLGTLLVCVLVVAALPAVAGTVFKLKTENLAGGQGGDATVYVDKDKLRIDSNESGTSYSVIFKSTPKGKDAAIYWIINQDDKTYHELTRQDMERLQQQVEQSMEAVKKQMAQLPPSRRKQVERAYRRQLGVMGRGDEMFQYNEVSKGAKVGKWSCTQYAGLLGDEKQEDVWAATWSELGAPREDFAVVVEMAEMFSSAGQKVPAFFQFGRIKGTDEFPVMVVSYQDGKQQERSQVQSVEQKALEADLFELPPGLTKKEPAGETPAQ